MPTKVFFLVYLFAFLIVNAKSAEVDEAAVQRRMAFDRLRMERKAGNKEPALTKADIPTDAPDDVKTLIEKTFSSSAHERSDAATHLGDMQERATSAAAFLIPLIYDYELDGSHFVHRIQLRELNIDLPVDVQSRVDIRADDALCKIGKPAVDACLAELKRQAGTLHGDILMRLLARIQDERAIKPMIDFLNDSDPCVREVAADALPGWNEPRFVPALIEDLKNGDDLVREAASRAMIGRQDSRLVPPLINALDDNSKDVRWRTLEALGGQKDDRVIPTLLRFLRDPAKKVYERGNAAIVLGEIGDSDVRDELLTILKDRSQPAAVRLSAAFGLGISKDHRFAEPLLAIAKNRKEKEEIRSNAVIALAILEGSRELAELTRLAANAAEDEHVRYYAAIQVVKLTKGATDDVGVASGLRRPFINFDGYCPNVQALYAISKQGKTESVRSAAKNYLKTWCDWGTPLEELTNPEFNEFMPSVSNNGTHEK